LSVVVNFALDGMCSMNYGFPFSFGLKRSSFALETRALQTKKKHQEVLPKYVKPIAFTLNDPPCEDKLGNVTIQTSVPNITTKAKQA
jgi:hypothetical protein